TILVNLLRGAGLDGLAPMRDRARIRRPILALRRHETRDLCRAVGWSAVEDPTNQDRRFVRNRIRHELLPLVADIAARDPVPVLVRQADLLGADAALLDDLAARVDPTDAKALAAAPEVLARRAVRRWLRSSEGPEQHPPSSAEVERVLDVACGRAVACELSGGRRVRRGAGRLSITIQP
ncbi:MAG: TilS substrate-binding domain-containing protein, partial [Actinomycetota bacterium]|nr:TilS substrate-binding domain-containing protein [Actinomycetota bacterium]